MRSPRNFIDFGMSGCPENAISVHKERHRPFFYIFYPQFKFLKLQEIKKFILKLQEFLQLQEDLHPCIMYETLIDKWVLRTFLWVYISL